MKVKAAFAAAGEVRIGIFAKEDVLPGVEITYDYMFQHGGLAAAAAAYRCAVLSIEQPLAAQPPSVAMSLQMMAACTMECIMGSDYCLPQPKGPYIAGAGAEPPGAGARWTASPSASGTLGSASRCGTALRIL
jgi:hypothetical protein